MRRGFIKYKKKLLLLLLFKFFFYVCVIHMYIFSFPFCWRSNMLRLTSRNARRIFILPGFWYILFLKNSITRHKSLCFWRGCIGYFFLLRFFQLLPLYSLSFQTLLWHATDRYIFVVTLVFFFGGALYMYIIDIIYNVYHRREKKRGKNEWNRDWCRKTHVHTLSLLCSFDGSKLIQFKCNTFLFYFFLNDHSTKWNSLNLIKFIKR